MKNIKQGAPKRNVQIHYRITVDEFLRRIKEDPMSVYSDYDVRYAIEKLRSLCQNGRKDDLILAKRILNEAGLSAFIPKQAQERMTENENLRMMQAHPFQFFQKVEEIKKKIQPFLQKRYTLYELDKKEEDIKKPISLLTAKIYQKKR